MNPPTTPKLKTRAPPCTCAMAWETAVDGVRTVQEQLNDLLGRDHGTHN